MHFRGPTTQHTFHEVESPSRPYPRHLEFENLIRITPLTWKLVLLHIRLVTRATKLGGSVYYPKPAEVFEVCHLVAYTRQTKLLITIYEKKQQVDLTSFLLHTIKSHVHIPKHFLGCFQYMGRVGCRPRRLQLFLDKAFDLCNIVTVISIFT